MEDRNYTVDDIGPQPLPEPRPMTTREMLVVLGQYNRKTRRTAAALLRRRGDKRMNLEQVFEHITGQKPQTTQPLKEGK